MSHIRKGDEVVVIAGKDIGRRGRVLAVHPKKNRVTIEKVSMIKKHVRPSQKHPQGGIIEKEGTVNLSNVMLWDPKAQAPCRVGVMRLEDGRKARVSKKTGEVID